MWETFCRIVSFWYPEKTTRKLNANAVPESSTPRESIQVIQWLKKLSEYELWSTNLGQDNAPEGKRPRIITDDVITVTSTQRDYELSGLDDNEHPTCTSDTGVIVEGKLN